MRYSAKFVVLFAMAFQLCWAAWGAYCSHEREAVTMHWGHHSHLHATDISDSLAGTDDGDCAMCHFFAAAGSLPTLSVDVPPRTALVPHPTLAYRSYIPPVPERPERNLV